MKQKGMQVIKPVLIAVAVLIACDH